MRTHFLGDGIVWCSNLTSGQFPSFSEPLASATWHGWVLALRALRMGVDEASLAALPVICGVVTAALFALLASETAATGRGRLVATVLLLCLGVMQLAFGYVESYPIVAVLVAAYLLLGVRAARTGRLDPGPGVLLALVAAAHMVSLTLVPSYAWLVLRSRTAPLRKVLLSALPVLLAAALFAWLRFGISDLLRPFEAVGIAITGPGTPGRAGASLWGRWSDLANLALILAPAPILVLAARIATGGAVSLRERPPGLWFLAIAAAPGLLATPLLVLPSSPAQDWDLLALVLLPAAVFAAIAGARTLDRAPRAAAAGAGLLAGAGLASFVLVNADIGAGIHRFEALVGDEATLAGHERAYGNEKLATYWADRGDYERALAHARVAVQAEPSNPRYWVKAGGALTALGREREAVPMLQEALRREPGRADASYDLGICYAKANRYAEATDAFRAAVAADGDRPDYRHNLGLMLYAQGKTDSARLVWTEVLRRWEGYPLTVRSMERRFGGGESTATAVIIPNP